MTTTFTRTVVRFAPSPNGHLHLGHAYSALMNQLIARETAGRLLVRMEDIDTTRCRPEFEAAICEDLAWLGLAWERPVRRQSEHLADYAAALENLERRALVYPCFCSRGDIMAVVSPRPSWPTDPDGTPLYAGTCKHMSPKERERRLAAGEKASYRLDMERALRATDQSPTWTEYRERGAPVAQAASPAVWGDAVLARKDIATSYHIAVVVDDAAQGITDVVRGEDLFQATSLHRMLQDLLDLPAPAYHHHHLLRDGAGQKLAKSMRAKSLRSFRQEGRTREEVLARICPPERAMARV